MAANRRSVEKEVGQLLQMSMPGHDDWCEIMGATELKDSDRKRFNQAFGYFTAGCHDRAYRGFARLAANGCCVSQFFLGLMYLKGTGVLQDYRRAHWWLNVASSQGHHKARTQLEKLTRKMSPNQVAEAQKLAQAWVGKHCRRH